MWSGVKTSLQFTSPQLGERTFLGSGDSGAEQAQLAGATEGQEQGRYCQLAWVSTGTWGSSPESSPGAESSSDRR